MWSSCGVIHMTQPLCLLISRPFSALVYRLAACACQCRESLLPPIHCNSSKELQRLWRANALQLQKTYEDSIIWAGHANASYPGSSPKSEGSLWVWLWRFQGDNYQWRNLRATDSQRYHVRLVHENIHTNAALCTCVAIWHFPCSPSECLLLCVPDWRGSLSSSFACCAH